MCVHTAQKGPEACSLRRKLLRKSHWFLDKEEQGQSKGLRSRSKSCSREAGAAHRAKEAPR